MWHQAGDGLGVSAGTLVDFAPNVGSGDGQVMQLDEEGSYAPPVVADQHLVGIMTGDVFEEVEVQYCPVGVSVSDCFSARDPNTGDLLYLKHAYLKRNQVWDFPPSVQIRLIINKPARDMGSFSVEAQKDVGGKVSKTKRTFTFTINPRT